MTTATRPRNARGERIPRAGTKARANYDRRQARARDEAREHARAVSRILAAYDMADNATRAEGRAWYDVMLTTCAMLGEQYNVPTDRVAGVLAITSPMQTVSENIRYTESMLDAHARGDNAPPRGYFLDASEQAWAFLKGEDSPLEWHTTRDGTRTDALKTRSFYRNILGQLDYVTVDRWIARIVTGHPDPNQPTAAAYRRIEAAFIAAAARVGESPRDLQAIVWIVTRGKPW